MKRILLFSSLTLFISGTALAGGDYDTCIREEKSLRAREADDCSGMRYLFNPSGCFAAKRILKEHAAGACSEFVRAGRVGQTAPHLIQEKKTAPVAVIPATSKPTSRTISDPATTPPAGKTMDEVSQPTASSDQLKTENARLKAEIERLKMENEKLKK